MPTKLLIAMFSLLLLISSNSYAGAQARPDDNMRSALTEAIQAAASFEDRFEAEVWLLDMSTRSQRFEKDHDEIMKILRIVHEEATRAELDPQLVLAVIEVESAFERFAISSAGALGLMQVMPFWTEELGRPEDNLFEMRTNIRYGCTILKHYLQREKGNLTRALARYNGSVGQYWYPRRVYKALDRNWQYY